MPTLPSGRRVEFSLDRFHALLNQLTPDAARRLACRLEGADDLLFVMDAVHFGQADGTPYFAGYVAAEWGPQAADWSTADRQALQAWLASPAASETRAEAVDYIRGLFMAGAGSVAAYPYLLQGEMRQAFLVQGAQRLQ